MCVSKLEFDNINIDMITMKYYLNLSIVIFIDNLIFCVVDDLLMSTREIFILYNS